MCTGLVDAWSASIMLECRCWFPLSKWPNTTNEPTGFVGWNLIVWQNPWCSPWVMVQPQTQIVEIYEPFIPKSGEFYRCHRLTYTIHYHPLPSISIHYHPLPSYTYLLMFTFSLFKSPLPFQAMAAMTRSSRVRCTWFANRSRALVVVFWLLASTCRHELKPK